MKNFSKKISALVLAGAMAMSMLAITASARTTSVTANVLGGTLTGQISAVRTSSTNVSISGFTSFTASGTRWIGLDATDWLSGTAQVANLPTSRSNASGNATISGTLRTPANRAITVFSSHEVRQTQGAAVRYLALANV